MPAEAVRLGPVSEAGVIDVTTATGPPWQLVLAGGLTVAGAAVGWTAHEPGRDADGRLRVRSVAPGLSATSTVREADGAITVALSVTNESASGVEVGGLCSLVADVAAQPERLHGFASGWGMEFEPVSWPGDEPLALDVSTGRSAQGHSPWLLAELAGGSVVVAPHWSGNWQIFTAPAPDGIRISAGLGPVGITVELPPGETVELPAVTLAGGTNRSAATQALVRSALLDRPTGPPLLTEWNHWWPYEDQEITSAVFLANAEIAADLGLEVAVLDAGWFGGSAIDSDWVAERGDWHLVNAARFPEGLSWLADQTRSRGIDFGIWIEAEAVGGSAQLRTLHPEFLATAAGAEGTTDLGYLCQGSPAAAAYVADTLRRLVSETGARWVKWDFNLDPGAGCDRTDHGHRADDGLLRHYQGLYATLDRMRADFPDTVWEACSSGGLRIDLGLAAHVDGLFLSDPDWTEHHLTCLWGVSQLLPPRQVLHWVQSEWRGEHRFQKVDYSGSLLTEDQFDLKVRSALLHRFGISARLPKMRPALLERLRFHLQVYCEQVRPLLESGVLVPLTDQPLRFEQGERRPAFQLTSGDEHLVAAFRLPGTSGWESVRPRGLNADDRYRVRVLEVDGAESALSGAALMADGIPLPTGSSTLVLLTPA